MRLPIPEKRRVGLTTHAQVIDRAMLRKVFSKRHQLIDLVVTVAAAGQPHADDEVGSRLTPDRGDYFVDQAHAIRPRTAIIVVTMVEYCRKELMQELPLIALQFYTGKASCLR